MTTAEFFKRTVIVLCVALVSVLIWFLFDVILIVVGAILIGVLLHLVAEPLIRWCKLPQSLALVVSGILIIGAVGGAAYLFGTQIEAELADVVARASAAATQITTQLRQSTAGKLVLSHIQGGNGFSLPGFVSRIFSVRRQVPRSTRGDGYRRILSRLTPGALSQGPSFLPARRGDRLHRVEKLCVRDSLGEATVLPGEPQRRGQRMAG